VTIRGFVLLLALAAACARDSNDRTGDDPRPVVPGIETAIAEVDHVRDIVRAPGVVTPDGLVPEARDARNDLAAAEARLRLATQQTARLRALAPGNVSPRKDLEAAIAEEASAQAAAARAQQIVNALGGRAEPGPAGAGVAWIVARVPQEVVPLVTTGAAVAFTADLVGRPVIDGIVESPPAYVDAASRLAPVRIRVQDGARQLLPGMTGSAAIDVGAPHDAVVVPENAVVYDDRRPLVFVDDGHGGFAPTVVRLGVLRGGRAEIADGVAAGARVATTGAASLLSATRLDTRAVE
jgi:hypothetical protein